MTKAAATAMLHLLRWHGAEEMEHRSVAFDLSQHLSGSYARRARAMALSATAMAYLWARGTQFFLRHDPSRPSKASGHEFRRAGRQGRLPTAGELLRTITHYFTRSYHPSQLGSTEDALRYLARSPAATAAVP